MPNRTRTDAGLTVAELAVVVAIGGALVVVLAYGATGMAALTRSGTCVVEERALAAAQDGYFAEHSQYASEQVLVQTGRLATPSSLYDVAVLERPSRSYTLVARGGRC